ncbi:MAG: ECF-type sigma factor [Gemmataceae bacterium]
MRRILVEAARRRARLKRGGAANRVALEEVEVLLRARTASSSPSTTRWTSWPTPSRTPPRWSSCASSPG